MTAPKFAMSISLNVLEHLGINLYSNVPSVLSEVVANSWDADAGLVTVTFNKATDTIVIADNGMGMTARDVNDRFLKVGYRRRISQPPKTPKGRLPMGRKGIGKLSLFSIANQIDVETAKDGEQSAFRMMLEEMRDAIKNNEGQYEPTPIPTDDIDFAHGNRITLTGLKKRQTISTAAGLRKRLARRFAIIGPDNDFEIEVNGKKIVPADRGYFDKIRYIWTYGDQSQIINMCDNVEEVVDRTTHAANSQVTVTGWLGTVAESSQLKDELNENLNRIAIFIRGKMAQEDILGEFTERGVYASYLIGELHVDSLDDDHEEDAATSSRQKIVEDDPRYVATKDIVGNELKHIQTAWAKLRSDAGAEKAMQIPAIASWIDGLPKSMKPKAKRWLGKINQISVDEPEERRQLWKHAVLAFEFYRWNENLERLETIDEDNIDAAIQLFSELDSLEASLYGQIVQQRVEVIKALQKKVKDTAKERVIQSYIFDHLWLLDPSWERVEATAIMEARVETEFEKLNSKLTKEEREGRLDIKYRKTAGKHVIVELKRPGVPVSVYALAAQVGKYRSALRKILRGIGEADVQIEIVCLLGSDPGEAKEPDGMRTVEETLRVQGARYLLYDQLLQSAYLAYEDYTKRTVEVDRLGQVIAAIDEYAE